MLRFLPLSIFVLSLFACGQKGRPRVEIQTPLGKMVVELYNETPQHRDNFLKLVREGAYDSLLFHRVQPNAFIQGGDPQSRPPYPPHEAVLGNGALDKTIAAEMQPQFICKRGAIVGFHLKPSLSASSSSQFLLIQGRYPIKDYQFPQIEAENGFTYTKEQKEAYKQYGGMPQMDRKYTVFGEIVEGFDVLEKITEVPASPRQRPLQNVFMLMREL